MVESFGTEEGSTVVVLDSPKLAEAARDRFAQIELWSELDREHTCLDVLADSSRMRSQATPD